MSNFWYQKVGILLGAAVLIAVVAMAAWTHNGSPASGPAAIAAATAVTPTVDPTTPVAVDPVAATPVTPTPVVAPAAQGRPVALRHRHYWRRVYVRRRPFSHSAAIVGGSALAGAGVGALAGGGHGAIVGGLVGGVGGLIYDRKTHKRKRVVVER
jgi:hypothetical protein